MYIWIVVTRLDDTALNSSNEIVFQDLAKATDAFQEIRDNNKSFHAPTIYKYGKYLFLDLRVLRTKLPEAKKYSFEKFMICENIMSKMNTSRV